MMVEYFGSVGLKAMVFKFKWLIQLKVGEFENINQESLMCLHAGSMRNMIHLSYLVIVIKFVLFLIRGYDIHQPTIGGHVQKLCLEGFEKPPRMLLLRYKMIHTTKLLHRA